MFRALWLAAVVSNIGTWMAGVGAAWLMTTLTDRAWMVALVQAATNLPVFLLALPAGALADILDRRRYLLAVQAGTMVIATALAATALLGDLSPARLLWLTFGLGAGAALTAPAWQAIMPELVPHEELSAAVALNSAGINVSRAIGPALGGAIVAAAGAWAAFALNALSFLGIIGILAWWRQPPTQSVLPAERVFGAVRAGLRYARGSPQLVSVLVRAGAFYLFASAVWALLPLVARVEFGLGAGGYGVLLALLGAGGVAGAFLLPRIRERVSADRVVLLATLTFAASTGALAWVRNLYAACAAAALTGVAWIGVLSCLNVAAQRAVPSWVRARGLSVYLAVFFGALTAGSALWGAVASRLGNPSALLLAAGGMAAGLVATRGFPLPDEEEIDLAPSTHWPAPLVSEEPELHRGPILVTTEYRIAPDRAEEFAALMRGLQRIRRREGAHYWELFQDAGDPTRFVEIFLVESWVEHLRQHERVTVADRQVQERAAAFHAGDEPPVVTHFLAASPSKEFLGGHGG